MCVVLHGPGRSAHATTRLTWRSRDWASRAVARPAPVAVLEHASRGPRRWSRSPRDREGAARSDSRPSAPGHPLGGASGRACTAAASSSVRGTSVRASAATSKHGLLDAAVRDADLRSTAILADRGRRAGAADAAGRRGRARLPRRPVAGPASSTRCRLPGPRAEHGYLSRAERRTGCREERQVSHRHRGRPGLPGRGVPQAPAWTVELDGRLFHSSVEKRDRRHGPRPKRLARVARRLRVSYGQVLRLVPAGRRAGRAPCSSAPAAGREHCRSLPVRRG